MEATALSSDLIQIEALRERDWRLVVQRHLRALPVVEDFDVFADRHACLLARGEALMIDQIVLQRSPDPDVDSTDSKNFDNAYTRFDNSFQYWAVT